MRDVSKCYLRKISVEDDGTLKDANSETSETIVCPIRTNTENVACSIDCAFSYEEQQQERTVIGCTFGNAVIGILQEPKID